MPVIVMLLHSYTFFKIIHKIIIADKFGIIQSMLMKQRAESPLHPSLLLTGGPHTLVVTSEGAPLSVPTSLLVLYSSRMLASLLVSDYDNY